MSRSFVLTIVEALRAENGPRPCDCTSCDCGNSGDACKVASWDGAEWALNRLEERASGSHETVSLISAEELKEMLLRSDMSEAVTLPIDKFRDLCFQAMRDTQR